MNGSSKPSSERLYLHQDANDEIFVDSTLHQHHIDGIRFLYKQFKKNKLGVIINNPLGYGNSFQVALFLGAIRHILDKPILILCEQSEELNWLEHFQKLTQCYNVGVGADNPFVKKSIFINTLDRLESFCRREWSVMVVDDDVFLEEKTFQSKFKADFKIWITPVDMKVNLQMFTSIFKWLFPKDKFNMNDFKADPGDRIGMISKSIMLETFLEDIVCRTTLQTPFENPYHGNYERYPKKVSKKNKDATGTKIKRSKRPLDAANTAGASSSGSNDVVAGGSAVKIPKTEDPPVQDFNIDHHKNEDTISDDKDKKSDIESFIRDEPPIRFDPFNEFDNVSRNSPGRTEFTDEPMFDTAERLNRLLESNVCMDIAANPEGCFIDSDSNSDSLLPLPKVFDDTSQLSNDSNFGGKRSTPDFLTDNILNEIKEEMSEGNNLRTPIHKNDGNTIRDDNEVNIDLGNDMDVDLDKEVPTKNKEPDIVDCHDKMKGDEVKEPEKDNKESDIVKESPSKNLDAKIREMDERAFKKFHGSILDSLF